MSSKTNENLMLTEPPVGGAAFPALPTKSINTSYLPASLTREAILELDDDCLIDLTLQGNESAYEGLMRRHRRRVFSIARHFFRSQETVEDVVQETFTKAYFSLSSYRRGAAFDQWLAKIALNNCYDELRRRKKRSESLLTDLSDDEESWLENKLARSSFDIHFSEDQRGIAAEISGKLLAKLSPDDRLILTLLHAEDNSIREISQITGWSEAKVKIRAFRARHAMRRAFARLKKAEERLTSNHRPDEKLSTEEAQNEL